MKLIVHPSMTSKFEFLRIEGLVATGVNNRGVDESLRQKMARASEALSERMDRPKLEAHPHIQAWREAYRAFGFNPKKKRPSAEAYLRRVVDGKHPGWISKVVDTYLLAEIEGLLPVGGYDLDNVAGDISLRTSHGGELFTSIGSTEPEETRPDEVVYADSARVLTRAWNYRDCDHTKIHEGTQRLALFVEAPSAEVSDEALRNMVNAIARGLEEHCGASVQTVRLDPRETDHIELAQES